MQTRGPVNEGLVVPAPLVPRRGVRLAQPCPEAEGTVAHRQQGRGGEAPLAQPPQHARPGLGALAVAELHREQLLAPILAGPDDHQQAGSVGLGPRVEVDAVRPQVGVGGRERARPERLVLRRPLRLEPDDGRRAQGGRLAHQLAHGGLEVARAEALEVQAREQALGVLGQVAAPGQEGRGEGLAALRQVRDARRPDLHRPGADTDLALPGVAVAVARATAARGIAGTLQERVHLGREHRGEHAPGALEADRLERVRDHRGHVRPGLGGVVTCHRGVPPFDELSPHRKGTPCSRPVRLGSGARRRFHTS